MITIPGKVPLVIHPIFLAMVAFIGYLYSGTLGGTFLWMAIITFSVLIHEFGHAMTAYYFGQKPRIELLLFGGRTSYEGKNLSLPKQFLIVFDGPLFGFLLFLAAHLLLRTSIVHTPILLTSLSILQMINFYWTLLNLLPVLPLDGGQLFRIILEFFFGVKGFKASLFIGMVISLGFALYFLMGQYWILGFLFFFFAFESFDLFRTSKLLTASDRKEEFAQELLEAEKALKQKEFEKAKELLERIRSETKEGMIFVAASQYLALLYLEEKKSHEAYLLLLSVKKGLDENLIELLHELSFEEKNYPLVAELASNAFQQRPTSEVALRSARAFAALNDPKAAGGWLLTALELGKLSFDEVVKEEIFSHVKGDPAFGHFFKKK